MSQFGEGHSTVGAEESSVLMEDNGGASFAISSTSPLKTIEEMEQQPANSLDGSSNEGTLPISEDSNISDSKSDVVNRERMNTIDRLTNLSDNRHSTSFSRGKSSAKLPSVSLVALLFIPLKRTPVKEEKTNN